MNSATLPSTSQNGFNHRVESPDLLVAPPVRDTRDFQPEPEIALPPVKNNRRLSPKRAALLGLVVLTVLTIVWFGREWWTVGRYVETTDDAYVGGDVTVIAPKVPGFISQVAVTDNQSVKAGDLLVKVDDRDFRAALAKADAVVDIQKATLANLEATHHLQEALVAQAQAEIAAADAEIVRTRDDQARYQHLVETSVESMQSFQKADASYKQAVAGGDKTRAGLVAAQRQMDVIDTRKQQAQAALNQAIAERDLAQLNLSYTELRAPIDGIVGNRSARVGAYATTGSQLISLVPARGLWIDANFKESQLAQMRPGAPVNVQVDSIPGKTFRGHVISVAPATGAQFSVLPTENATGNFTKIVQRVAVRIALDDEAAAFGQLRPGLSVTAKVNTVSVERASL